MDIKVYPKQALSPAGIENLLPKAKPYKISAGNALYLDVMPNGAKYWRLKYRFEGKEKRLALGIYPDVSLQDAMKATHAAKALLKKGINPMDAKREAAKNKLKPVTAKALFRMNLSDQGTLTVETATRLVMLTKTQTDALRAFLLATPDRERT